MQSVCSVLPGEFKAKVVDARAALAQDPGLGMVYDPPFAHFTHQLAQEYEWEGLEQALTGFARRHQPFEVRTTGLMTFGATIVIGVYRSLELIDYHADLWETISPFTSGRVDGFYEPDSWLPHVTIKRCGSRWQAFGNAMASLAQQDFAWELTIDNVAVQHDPGQNSQTHYQRLWFPLGGRQAPAADQQTNASVLDFGAPESSDAEPSWRVRAKLDGGGEVEVAWTAPEWVRLMAAANSSSVHFAGGRCRVEDGRIVAVSPNTPLPVAG